MLLWEQQLIFIQASWPSIQNQILLIKNIEAHQTDEQNINVHFNKHKIHATMKQLLIIITLIYTWVALALEKGQSNDEQSRYLRTKGTRNICIQLGKPYGRQTLEVPKDDVRFFTSQRRSPPAKVRWFHNRSIDVKYKRPC